MTSQNQQVLLPLLSEKKITLYLKREDLLHPLLSGNKYRKLKYNLVAAQTQAFKTVLTFGGAYSNHIAATAYAAKEAGFKSIGIIRGEELVDRWQANPTLRFAQHCGMQFQFVSRAAYREKTTRAFLTDLQAAHGQFYLIPEGGTNAAAVQGCEEILTVEDADFDLLCACVGTGGTLAGIIRSAFRGQKVLGFPALKGDFLNEDIRSFVTRNNWSLQCDYHFGGYAKTNESLIRFINDFKHRTGIPLDPIYTGKMLFGILDLVEKDFFVPKTRILAIHTGGLQGIAGMNRRLKKKKLPQIDL